MPARPRPSDALEGNGPGSAARARSRLHRLGCRSRLGEGQALSVRRGADLDRLVGPEPAAQQELGERILDEALDRAAQRTRAVVVAVPLADQEVDRRLVEVQADALLGQ